MSKKNYVNPTLELEYTQKYTSFQTFCNYIGTHGPTDVCDHVQELRLLDTPLHSHYWFKVKDQIFERMSFVFRSIRNPL